MIRTLLTALAALALGASSVLAQERTVTVTFDDLPYQAPDRELCDPAKAMALTRDFVDTLRPLDTQGVAFVNEGKGCEARRAELLPPMLAVWLDAGLELGNHTFSHPGLNAFPVEDWLAEVDRGPRSPGRCWPRAARRCAGSATPICTPARRWRRRSPPPRAGRAGLYRGAGDAEQ